MLLSQFKIIIKIEIGEYMPPKIITLSKEAIQVKDIFDQYNNSQTKKSRTLLNQFLKNNSIGDFVWIAQKEIYQTPHQILTFIRNSGL